MAMNHFHLWDGPMGCERLFEDQQQLLSPGQSDVLRGAMAAMDSANMGDFARVSVINLRNP